MFNKLPKKKEEKKTNQITAFGFTSNSQHKYLTGGYLGSNKRILWANFIKILYLVVSWNFKVCYFKNQSVYCFNYYKVIRL